MEKEDKKDKKEFSEVISSWIMKYRVILLGFFGVVILAIIGICVYSFVDETARKNGFTKLDEYEVQAKEIWTDTETNVADLKVKEDDILTKVNDIAAKNKNNAIGARAYLLAAEIEFKNTQFEKARDNWYAAANANKKAYTACYAYYNAGICCEELGDYDNALINIDKALSYDDFAIKPRAIFNAGRIEEQRGNFKGAEERYTKLNDDFSGDSWANLAKTRLITLEVEGKIATE